MSDTALAAKDASEKVIAELLEYIEEQFGEGTCDCRPEPENQGHVCVLCKARALTPAPTQEPPAVIHGVTCEKVCHERANGYLHAPDDDGPYDVDGLKYCGRCHTWLPEPPAGGVTISTEKKGGEAGMFIESPLMKGASDVQPEGRPADVPSEGRGDWMPIGTAPKDGRSIILFRGGYVRIGYWDNQKYHSKPRPFWNDIGHLGVEACRRLIPTHWQPLPPPPMLPTEGSGA